MRSEGVTLAVLPRRVVRPAGADHIDHFLLLGQFLERDVDCRADAAGNHDCLVLRDELGCALNGRIRLRLGVGDFVDDLLAEQSFLAGERGDLGHHAGSVVKVIQGQEVAFSLVLAVGGNTTRWSDRAAPRKIDDPLVPSG